MPGNSSWMPYAAQGVKGFDDDDDDNGDVCIDDDNLAEFFCTMGTGSFSRVKSGRGVTLTPHPF